MENGKQPVYQAVPMMTPITIPKFKGTKSPDVEEFLEAVEMSTEQQTLAFDPEKSEKWGCYFLVSNCKGEAKEYVEGLDDETRKSFVKLKAALRLRFNKETDEVQDEGMDEISSLRQKSKESLAEYLARGKSISKKIGRKNTSLDRALARRWMANLKSQNVKLSIAGRAEMKERYSWEDVVKSAQAVIKLIDPEGEDSSSNSESESEEEEEEISRKRKGKKKAPKAPEPPKPEGSSFDDTTPTETAALRAYLEYMRSSNQGANPSRAPPHGYPPSGSSMIGVYAMDQAYPPQNSNQNYPTQC